MTVGLTLGGDLKLFATAFTIGVGVREFISKNPEEDIFEELLDEANDCIGSRIIPWNAVKKFADQVLFYYAGIKWRMLLGDDEFKKIDKELLKDHMFKIWRGAIMDTLSIIDGSNLPLEKISILFVETLEKQLNNQILNHIEEVDVEKGKGLSYYNAFQAAWKNEDSLEMLSYTK